MSKHATYGGSVASRTLNCTAWAPYCATIPQKGTSSFADTGTLLHNAMEVLYGTDGAMLADVLPTGFTFDGSIDPKLYEGGPENPERVIGMTYEGIVLTEGLFEDKIVPAIAALEAIFAEYGVVDWECEAHVVLAENAWGTADILAEGEKDGVKVAVCVDFKFGDGVLVDAENNDQLLFYAAGAEQSAVAEFFEGALDVVLAIIQPSKRGEDYSTWDVTVGHLENFQQDHAEAVQLSESGNGEFKSGSWCKFCPGSGTCPATSGEMQALARLDVTNPELAANLPFSYEDIERIVDGAAAYKKLVHEQLEVGVNIPGWKLVAKRASRVYTDEDAVRDILHKSRKIKKADAFKMTLKTPAQLEKMCKTLGLSYKDLFAEHIDMVSSGTTLADESDKRQAVGGIAELEALLARD